MTIKGFVHKGVEFRRGIFGGRGVLYRLGEDVKVVCFPVDRVRTPEAVSAALKLPATAKVNNYCLEVPSSL